MSFKLLALDLDGTLVADKHTIPARTQAAIKAAAERGAQVVIATGREYAVTQKFMQMLNLTTPLICYQGAWIYHPATGATIAREGLPLPLAHHLIDVARAEALALNLYFETGARTENPTPQSRRLYRETGAELTQVADLKLSTTRSPIKGLVVHPPEQGDALLARLRESLGNRMSVFRSLDVIIEVTSPNVSKGKALAQLAHYFDIPQRDVMAVGDQDNDIEMVAWAGLGVAMGNASAGVKAVANQIAPPVSQEGAAWAIETFVLGD